MRRGGIKGKGGRMKAGRRGGDEGVRESGCG